MTKIIAIDFDETIAESFDTIFKYHNYKINNITISKDEVTNYQIRETPKYKKLWITIDDCIKIFNDFLEGDDYYIYPDVQWAKAKIQERKNKWYVLKILTARPERQRKITEMRVEEHFPNTFDSIVFANHFTEETKSKSEICKEIWAKIMIEDNFQYAEDLAKAWITTYLLAKPWNTEYKNTNPLIIKINTRDEIHL